jgi:hypothetical protein
MATMIRKNVGSLVTSTVKSVRTAPSFTGETYSARSCVWDAEMNEWVSFYWFDEYLPFDESGAQCIWIGNNAAADDEEEFGIKLTERNLRDGGTAKSAAYAMYQRQKLAAEHGYAPPVHGMCCVKWFNKQNNVLTTWWGYLSCVAETAVTTEIPYDPDTYSDYQEYVDLWDSRRTTLGKVEDLLNDIDVPPRTVRALIGDVENAFDGLCPDYGYEEWCEEESRTTDMYEGQFTLWEGLNNLSIQGLQNDYSDIGTNFEDDAVMGDDLHMNNVGLWKGNLVAIDFGYHCVCQ